MNVKIDRSECIQCAVCWEICPDVFEESEEDGFSQIRKEFRIDGMLGSGKVPENLLKCAQNAADACPVSIITVE